MREEPKFTKAENEMGNIEYTPLNRQLWWLEKIEFDKQDCAIRFHINSFEDDAVGRIKNEECIKKSTRLQHYIGLNAFHLTREDALFMDNERQILDNVVPTPDALKKHGINFGMTFFNCVTIPCSNTDFVGGFFDNICEDPTLAIPRPMLQEIEKDIAPLAFDPTVIKPDVIKNLKQNLCRLTNQMPGRADEWIGEITADKDGTLRINFNPGSEKQVIELRNKIRFGQKKTYRDRGEDMYYFAPFQCNARRDENGAPYLTLYMESIPLSARTLANDIAEKRREDIAELNRLYNERPKRPPLP